MKTLPYLFVFLLATVYLAAATTAQEAAETGILSSVYVPLLGPQKSLSIQQVPAMLFGGRPNAYVDAMANSVFPATVNAQAQKQDLNVLSRSGIRFRFEPGENAADLLFAIDVTDFKEDPDLPQLEDFVHALLACVRVQHPIGVVGAVDVKIRGAKDSRFAKIFEGHLWVSNR